MNLLLMAAITLTSAQTVAQISVEHLLNALPEGLLIAFFSWALLRVLRRQNSGTRFAVLFLALLVVAALPLLTGGTEGKTLASGMEWGHLHTAITIPGSWAIIGLIAWALGTCVAVTRLAIGLWHVRQLRRSCTAIAAADLDPIVRKTVEALQSAGSVGSKAVTIATSEEVRVPAAIGFRKRTIVLPGWALHELPPEDLNVILLHEFAHLRRGDDWTNLIQKIVRAIFFFHPGVWWIENRLSMEREMACDDAVLAETSNPRGYASCLVSLLEKNMAHRLAQKHLAQKRWSMAQAAVDRAREASLRLARILDADRPAATRLWKPALGVVGVFSLLYLLALPHAPQFIAFDRGMEASSKDASTAAISQGVSHSLASPGGAPGVLARMSASTELAPRLQDVRRSNPPPRALPTHRLGPVRTVAARWNGSRAGILSSAPAQMTLVGANSGQKPVPQLETLVFVEATQYLEYGSPVWSVQVWQVTFVSGVNGRPSSMATANSI
jgi:Zn-dependent protease with chaperone function